MNDVWEEFYESAKEKNTKLQESIDKGISFEKENNIDMALKSYERALLICTSENKTLEIFNLSTKLGDLYQICGELEKGLQCYLKSYNAAEILQNKVKQVDALNNIADSHISKGEIEESLKYAEIANKILNEIDYIKGKIENNICLSRICYIKKEFYKARDISNETLKLCGNEFPLLKGKIFISLGELYKDLTSVEENLELLNQAYECFEKADYKRGMFGVINNIAFVFGDKLQDYEKSLEYSIKLKDLCERSIYVEFRKICYLNIGEMYLKSFKYHMALFWLNKALKMPFGAYMDNILTYNYALLSQANLKLCNYKKAYDFFIKASEEVSKNSNVESTLVQYYKTAALIFIEYGETSSAKSFLRKALESVEKDETLVKWNIGLVYEYINLCEAKNEIDIIDIIDGIRYTLSKYKNRDEILDTVYDISIELINKGYNELAFNFLNEYSFMTTHYESLKLKKMFIEIKLNKCENIEILLNALGLAKEINNVKIEWRLCCLIGDYYSKNKDINEALSFYNDAFTIVKNMVISVPEEYRLQFANLSKFYEAYNSLMNVKQYYSEGNNENFNICKFIKSKEELDTIFNLTN